MSRTLRVVVVLATMAGITAGCARRAAAPPSSGDPDVKTIKQTTDLPTLPLPSEPGHSTASASSPMPAELPFAPAISMDPVDGAKVSIGPHTPVAEFNDRVYYFRTEENRAAFVHNPEKYAKSSLSRY